LRNVLPLYSEAVDNKTMVVIKPKNAEQPNVQTKFDLMSDLNPVELNINVTKVKNISNGGLLLHYGHSDNANKFRRSCMDMEKFIIAKDFVKKVKRFNLTGRTIEFKIKPVPSNEEPVSWIKEAVNQVIQKGTQDLSPDDQVAFSFCSKDFKRGDGWVRFRPVCNVTYDDVWDVISSVYQSNSTGLNTDTFCLGMTSVRMPAGKGKHSAKVYNTFNDECGKRRGIIVINNKDNMCLPRALVVAIACVSKDPDQIKVRRDIRKIQTQRAAQLCTDVGIVIPEKGCGIPELQKFQEHFNNYNIVVYNYGTKGRDTIFKGPVEGPSLNLIYHEGHFNVITSLTAAFACGYYCKECNIPYNVKNKHRCGGTCPCCQQTPVCLQDLTVLCVECKRSFRGQRCYDNHKKVGSMGKSTVCEQIVRCDECHKVMKKKRHHTCGEVYCKVCNTHVPQDHLCYMQSDTGKPKIKDILFVFYDLETRQEKVLDDGSLLHEPNLCVTSKRCDACMGESSNLYFCQKCGYRLVIHRENVIGNFMEYVLTARQKFKEVVVIAHNGQAFDHQFIMNHILTKTDLKPEPIMRGSKIIMMVVGNVKFLDSLNYFPMALSKLPKAFGLGDGFKKGYFPHLFNREENKNYVGPLPDVEFYSPDTMKEGDRQTFLKWHEKHKDDEFDMQRDLVDYCISDVKILTAACLKFRQQLMETGGVCPFTEACTIASCCNKVFRRNFLKPNTIGIIPKGGYRWRDNQSKLAIRWLVWEEMQRSISILHAAKQQEVRVHGVKVDGYCSETNQAFEFHGCYYHGCPGCFKLNRGDPMQDDPTQTLNSRHEATVSKTGRLRELGCEVVEMWECQFIRLLKSNQEAEEYTENHPLVISTPLNPRDAFYGGRTEVYVGVDCPKDITDGLVKCTILPPQHLYHPVLPVKMNDKLMFVLCRMCGQTMNQGSCTHNAEERSLTGTWVADEVIKAVEKGYVITEFHEIWKYGIDQYDRATKTDGLFREMMDTFIKVKQQASGWPGNCSTKAQKDRYIDEFLEREDVKLEFFEILENPGLRSLAKLILNSFWGKLGQRENQPKTTIVRNPAEFFGMLSKPEIHVNSVLPINEETLIVSWEELEEVVAPLATVNVVVAAYVTTQARLKLYSYLELLEGRVLYYDTDSIIYISKDGLYDVPTGEFIGDMTDELESYGAGSYISEFVSGGPKNYAYKVFSTKDQKEEIVCKVKRGSPLIMQLLK
ncbi:hypothetical protein NQ317_019537, partial [Molorchus minor]